MQTIRLRGDAASDAFFSNASIKQNICQKKMCSLLRAASLGQNRPAGLLVLASRAILTNGCYSFIYHKRDLLLLPGDHLAK